MDAHQKLTSIAKSLGKRNYFGVSYAHNNDLPEGADGTAAKDVRCMVRLAD